MVSRNGTCIRVLQVFAGTNRGGTELRTLDVMRHLDRARFRMDYCVLSGRPGTLDEEIRALGGEVFPCRLGLSFSWRFGRLLHAHRFDVVHAHVHHFAGWILRLAAHSGVPVRVAHFNSSHDGRADTLRRRLQRRVMCRWIDRHATHVLAVSEAAMEEAWRPDWRDDRRCAVVYDGLPVIPFEGPADRAGVRKEFGWPLECPLAIHVGRLAPPKNHGRLLAVFRAWRQRRPEARLLVVGSGPPPAQDLLRRQVGALGLEEGVALAGERTDVARLLKASDVLVFPSLWEGLPGAVLEACAAGTPVVASDLATVREVARHFPRVECVGLERPDDQWAHAIDQTFRSVPSEAERHAARRALAASPFGIERCVANLCRVWQGGEKAGNFPLPELPEAGRDAGMVVAPVGTAPFLPRNRRDRPCLE